jgi:hypothetical protein
MSKMPPQRFFALPKVFELVGGDHGNKGSKKVGDFSFNPAVISHLSRLANAASLIPIAFVRIGQSLVIRLSLSSHWISSNEWSSNGSETNDNQ